MPAGRVVDTVAPTSRRAPFQADELRGQARHVEQLHPPRIQQRQRITIQITFGLLGQLIRDPVNPEPLARPLARVSVSGDRVQSIDMQRACEFLHHVIRGERRTPLRAGVSGGRVLNVSAVGPDVEQARLRAYEAVAAIDWPGGFPGAISAGGLFNRKEVS